MIFCQSVMPPRCKSGCIIVSIQFTLFSVRKSCGRNKVAFYASLFRGQKVMMVPAEIFNQCHREYGRLLGTDGLWKYLNDLVTERPLTRCNISAIKVLCINNYLWVVSCFLNAWWTWVTYLKDLVCKAILEDRWDGWHMTHEVHVAWAGDFISHVMNVLFCACLNCTPTEDFQQEEYCCISFPWKALRMGNTPWNNWMNMKATQGGKLIFSAALSTCKDLK